MRCLADFVFCPRYTLVDYFRTVCASFFQTLAQFFYTGWHNEDTQGFFAKMFLDIDAPINIYVEDDILSLCYLFLNL